VEELRDPSLRSLPLCVTQKYLVVRTPRCYRRNNQRISSAVTTHSVVSDATQVTCNYVARALGVNKLMSIAQAKRVCPSVVLVLGEDLNPYRDASKRVLAVLQVAPAAR
jgi:nucleotidyltransferase/DNA polymerase involved in DNA repair